MILEATYTVKCLDCAISYDQIVRIPTPAPHCCGGCASRNIAVVRKADSLPWIDKDTASTESA
ncbi:MAG: hypothetical protein ACE5FM_05935 [Methyloligellaceae bacterium]